MLKVTTATSSPAPASHVPVISHAQAWQGFIAYLTPLRLILALGLATLGALLLSPIFATPLPVLLGRTLFVGLLGLLAFSAAGQWPRRLPQWMARWLLQVFVVVVAVPAATLVVYLIAVGGDIESLLSSPNRLMGFMWIAGSGLLVAPLLAHGCALSPT